MASVVHAKEKNGSFLLCICSPLLDTLTPRDLYLIESPDKRMDLTTVKTKVLTFERDIACWQLENVDKN